MSSRINQTLMNEVVIPVPDKIVADDILNYRNKKTEKHLFSDIYEGRTPISPNTIIEYYVTDDIIILYGGGWGMGTYVDVAYSIKRNKYIYYTSGYVIGGGKEYNEKFASENWMEFQSYVRKDFLDMYMWFNTPNKSIYAL